jgi:hypothetical protein
MKGVLDFIIGLLSLIGMIVIMLLFMSVAMSAAICVLACSDLREVHYRLTGHGRKHSL